jgi:hypothetical protein
MRSAHRCAIGSMTFIAVMRLASADSGIAIDHRPVECLASRQFPVIQARLSPAEQVARARVVFRAAGGPSWYGVDMKLERGVFRGILPRPLASTLAVDYYIDIVDRAMRGSRTPEITAAVDGDAACAPGLVPAASTVGAEIAVGSLSPGAPAVPAGFNGAGVLGTVPAGTVTGAAAGVSAGGMSTGLIVGIVGAGVAVGGVAVAASGGGDESPSPTAARATTPPPTTLPPTPPPPTTAPGTDVTGRWTGSLVITINPACDLEGDLTADLAQSGTTVTGDFVYRTRRHADRPDCRMEVQPMSASGSIAGATITLQVVVPEEGPMAFVGALSGNTISGTWSCTAICAQGGTWTLSRP